MYINEYLIIKYMNRLPWIEKYRPHHIDDIIAHENIIKTINNFIETNSLPHLLFYGPPGTGKTSSIIACARKIYGKNISPMIIHLNASDERGIDVVRQRIKDFATTRSFFGCQKHKLIILDEADSMTEDAQLALRQIIVNYTNNTRFCMICNYVGKIIPSLQSRFTKFRFSPLDRRQIYPKIYEIVKNENLKYDEEGLDSIYEISKGDMRKFINILQSICLSYGEITKENVHKIICKPLPKEILDIINILLNYSFNDSYKYIYEIIKNGLSLVDLIRYLENEITNYPFSQETLCYLYKNLSDIEFNCSENVNESFQLSGLISIFILAKFKFINNNLDNEILNNS